MRHYQENILIPVKAEELFDYIDDHARFSSHMNKSTWMMGGGHMDVSVDEGRGQRVGSHIRLSGKAFGISLFVDEVVTRHEPPYVKIWETIGEPKLIIVGNYRMEVKIDAQGDKSLLTVSIDYELPTKNRRFGKLFSSVYAKWCVRQMIKGASDYFATPK